MLATKKSNCTNTRLLAAGQLEGAASCPWHGSLHLRTSCRQNGGPVSVSQWLCILLCTRQLLATEEGHEKASCKNEGCYSCIAVFVE